MATIAFPKPLKKEKRIKLTIKQIRELEKRRTTLKKVKLSPIRKTKKVKKITATQAKKKAWLVFSKWLKYKYLRDDGMVECYTCGSLYPLEKIQTGHAIGGRNNSILFEEALVRPQCVICNVFKRGRYATFTYKLIKEIGIEEYEKLVEQSQQVVQYKVADFQEIEKKYKEKLESLNG